MSIVISVFSEVVSGVRIADWVVRRGRVAKVVLGLWPVGIGKMRNVDSDHESTPVLKAKELESCCEPCSILLTGVFVALILDAEEREAGSKLGMVLATGADVAGEVKLVKDEGERRSCLTRAGTVVVPGLETEAVLLREGTLDEDTVLLATCL